MAVSSEPSLLEQLDAARQQKLGEPVNTAKPLGPAEIPQATTPQSSLMDQLETVRQRKIEVREDTPGKIIRRVVKHSADALGILFETPLGMSRESLGPIVSQTREEAMEPGMGTLRAANEMIIRGTTAGADLVGRALWAPILAGTAAAEQALTELGVDSGMSRRFRRDIEGLAMFGALKSITPASLGIAATRQLQRIGAEGNVARPARDPKIVEEAIDRAVEGLPADKRPAAKEAVQKSMKVGEKAAEEVFGKVPDDLMEPRIAQPISQTVVDAAEELLTVGGVQRLPDRRLSDQIVELMTTDRLQAPEFQAVLKKHNITVDELAPLWRGDVTVAAQTLAYIRAAEANIKRMNADLPGAELAFNEAQTAAGFDGVTRGMTGFKTATDIWRGLLVSQLGTAVRNAETQLGRVGIDVMQRGLDQGLRTLFVNPARRAAGAEPITSPIKPFETLMRLVHSPKTKKQTEEILSGFPVEHDQLLMRYMSDVRNQKGGKDLAGVAQSTVNFVNIPNRFQEFTIRRAVFAAELDRSLAAKGLDLDEIVRLNQVGKIPRDTIKKAVSQALEITWGSDFPINTAAGSAINFINKVPGAAFAVPFPRFMANALRFQYEFSPLGMLKLLSKEERAAVARGETKTISRAMLGSSMFYTAWQIRNSEFAGERWYEVKTPGGRTVDLRAFNPFASYLLAADIVKRSKEGNLPPSATKEIIQGTLGGQFRAGAGLFLIDNMIEGFSGIGTGEKFERGMKAVGGNIIAGFLTPLQTIKDAVAEFDEAERTVKETGESPFLGPIQRRIPGAARGLPEVELPTREGPLMREEPFTRQITGLSFRQKKNIVESEMDRLALPRSSLSPKLPDPRADRLFRQFLGPVVEQAVVPLLKTEKYQGLIDPVKKLVMLEGFKEARKVALRQLQQEDPVAFARVAVARIPKLQRQAAEALTGLDLTTVIDQIEADLDENP